MFIRPKDRGSKPLFTAGDAFRYTAEAYGLTLDALRVSPVVIGAPAAVATVEDLFTAGLRGLITFGTAGGLQHDAAPAVLDAAAMMDEEKA